METEVKLSFKDQESLYGFASSELFRKYCPEPSVSEPVLLENTYLDTSKMLISERGGMIRIRHYSGNNKDSYEITVKCGGSAVNGLHKRYEWNRESSNGLFSMSEFIDGISADDDPVEVIQELFKDINDSDLGVICSNSFNRTTYEIKADNSRVEACFDSGMIYGAEGRSDMICELELELIEGSVDVLNRLSDEMVEATGCIPFEDTKYRRTVALALG